MEWAKSDLKILVGRMGWVRSYAFRRTALHRALFDDLPLITRVACSSNWSDAGYLENDRISCIQFLGRLKCLTQDLFGHSPLFEMMSRSQLPSLDCFRAVMEVLGPPKTDAPNVSGHPLIYIALRCELTLEMVDLFQAYGYDLSWKYVNGKDLLSELASGGHPVNPEVDSKC